MVPKKPTTTTTTATATKIAASNSPSQPRSLALLYSPHSIPLFQLNINSAVVDTVVATIVVVVVLLFVFALRHCAPK